MQLCFFLVWNSHLKKVKQPIGNPIKRLCYKSKSTQVARINAEAKGRDEIKQTLDARIYPVVRIATKAHLHPRCWSTHEEYRFPAIKSLPWTQSRSPWSRFPLRSFTKNGGGLHVPRTKLSMPLHAKSEGPWRCRRANKTPRGRRTELFFWFTLEPAHKAQHLAISLTEELT